ncbi:hypothetical protein SAMN06295960_4756 [Paenibacillus aquistagni]|uniref:Uncharacterized protein n=1 Tax=Paenibacillus aquistagni TaxID=1852522 RepID=A0A1X7LXT0_9BACL|nr:hypothetical protein SAMN06295960_4756 [Paenibacillus aquistagni]
MRDLISIRHERSLAGPFVPKISVRKLKVGRMLKREDGVRFNPVDVRPCPLMNRLFR